ncbi:hypothetical protein [Paenibacillus sanguinis]|uniref:hypothetical protein n=1 Tax=Paenibacillus sanguinis TaxID=225906 RepID=UPI00037B293C|nr:hypothetical protein [Paenibacillus sanguinis]
MKQFTLKKVVIIGTMALVIIINPNFTGYLTSLAYIANSSKEPSLSEPAGHEDNELDRLLGVSSEREVYDALLEGQSLAVLAEANGQPPQHVVDLQVKQLQAQLLQRVNDGSLTQEAYELQMRELPDLLASSVYGKYTIYS